MTMNGCRALALMIAAVALAVPLLAQGGGYNRTAITFGEAGGHTSDIAVCDFNFDDEADVLVAAATGDHMIYWSVSDQDPPSPTVLATSRGHSLLALDAFGGFGAPGSDLIIVDELGYRLYLNDGLGGFDLMDSYSMTGLGVPIFAQAGYFSSDSIKGLVVGYPECVVCMPLVYEEFIETPYYLVEFGMGITSMHAMDIVPGNGLTEILILEDDTVFVFAMGELELDLYGWASFPGAILIAPGNADGSRLAVVKPGDLEIYSWSVDPEEVFTLQNSGELPFNRRVREIAAAELTGDEISDFLVRSAGITYILKQLEEGFELYEFVGYPDGEQDARVLIADIDGDTHPDLVVARAEFTHQAFLNRARLQLTLHDADPVDWNADGPTFLEFVVELDAPPVSLVVVTLQPEEDCGCGEQSAGGPDPGWEAELRVLNMLCGFDLPDPGKIVKAQAPPPVFQPITISLFGTTTRSAFFQPLSHGSWRVCPVGPWIYQPPPPAYCATGVANQLSSPFYDWEVDGEVNTVTEDAGGRIYIGGDFTGLRWDINAPFGMAAMETSGNRSLTFKLPGGGTFSFSPRCMVATSGNYLYAAGTFSVTVNGVTISEVARINPLGELDLRFRPNPDFAVSAIAIDELPGPFGLMHNRVFLGGSAGGELQHQSNSNLNVLTRCVANVPAWDMDGYFLGGTQTTAVNRIRVTSESNPQATLPFPQDPAWIMSLAFANTADGPRLAIGGRNLFSIRFGGQFHNGTANGVEIRNLALVMLQSNAAPSWVNLPLHAGRFWGSSPTTGGYAAWQPPEVGVGTTPATNGSEVLSLAFADETTTFTDGVALDIGADRVLIFAGTFDSVEYRRGTALNQTLTSRNLGITTFSGHRPSTQQGHLPTDTTPVLSICVDQQDRVWAAREVDAPVMPDEPLWVYKIGPLQGGTPNLLERVTDFNFGPNGRVEHVAYNPLLNEVVAVGDFSARPSVTTYVATSTPLPFDQPAGNITVYSTTDAPFGVTTYDFGDHRATFRGASSHPLSRVTVYRGGYTFAAGYSYRNTLNGQYVVHPTQLDWIKAERANIAAMTVFGTIHDWGPRVDGPVNVIVVDDTAFPDPVVYYGGECKTFGLPMATDGLAAAPASHDAVEPLNWWVEVSGGGGSIKALVIATGQMVIGGSFTGVGSQSRNSIALVDKYNPTSPGAQDPFSHWVPDLYKSSGTPVVNFIYYHDNFTYVGGDFEGTSSVTRHGVAKFDDAGHAGSTGAIQTDFDAGLAAGNVVHGVTSDPWNFYLVGELGTFTAGDRVAIGVPWIPTSQGFEIFARRGTGTAVGRCVTVFGSGSPRKMVMGGNFHEVWHDGSASWQPRLGTAAFDINWTGNPVNAWSADMLSWTADPIDAQEPDEEVRAVMHGNVIGTPNWRFWVAGKYTGTSKPHVAVYEPPS